MYYNKYEISKQVSNDVVSEVEQYHKWEWKFWLDDNQLPHKFPLEASGKKIKREYLKDPCW